MKLLMIPVFSVALLMVSCTGKDAPNPCNGIQYTVDYFKTEAIGAASNGSITINFPVGDTISYKLNSGAYQSANFFNNLAPGNYVLTIKNSKGCTDTAQITILNYGPKYALVKQVVGGFCGPCHRNGGLSGGKNFDTDSGIIVNWSRIKARAVDNIPTQMPQLPNAMLTPIDKQKITDWVNAGHRQLD